MRYFDTLSDAQLVGLFRKSDDRQKNKIFKYLLHEKSNGGKTWYQKIETHVNLNVPKLKLDLSITKDDLISEAINGFHKTVTTWFEPNLSYGFSTYVWKSINDSINRIFQKITKTKKRSFKEDFVGKDENGNDKIESVVRYKVEINDEYTPKSCENGPRKWLDVISSEAVGNHRTESVKTSFEQIIFYKDIIKHLKELLTDEKVDAEDELIEELTGYIKQKNSSVKILKHLAAKYETNLNRIIKIKTKIVSNIEKSMFRDFIILMENDLKNYEDLEEKYSCSRAHLTKQRDKMSEKFMRNLYKLNLSSTEIFEAA